MSLSCPSVEDRDLLSLLRTCTRKQHLALEQHPLLSRLLAPDLDRHDKSAGLTICTAAGCPEGVGYTDVPHDYGLLLQAFWCFYQTLEPGLMAALPDLEHRAPLGAYRYRSRLPLLEADFVDLLLPKPAPLVASNATISQPSPGQALGILYVLEGATQGGRVIATRLRSSLGLSEARGAHYFNQHKYQCSWPVFCEWLRRYSWLEYQDAAIHGARQTFAGLAAQLNLWQVYSSDPPRI